VKAFRRSAIEPALEFNKILHGRQFSKASIVKRSAARQTNSNHLIWSQISVRLFPRPNSIWKGAKWERRTRGLPTAAALAKFSSTLLSLSSSAVLFRLPLTPIPFNGTDAAVADVGELEFELQPAGLLQEDANQTLVAPWLVTNFGFAKNWEAVLEGKVQTPLSSNEPPRLTDAGLSLKYVLREGSLQDKSGPSIATEFGTLLPGIGADAGTGGTWVTIISERWDWGTIHLNLQPSLTRDHRAELFVSTILEGPSKWKVRPVAEVFFDEKFDQETEVSGLVRLI